MTSIELFKGTNYNTEGRMPETFTNAIGNLKNYGFNDISNSCKVTGGYWILYSDANFQGESVLVGPHDYPNFSKLGMKGLSSIRPLPEINGPTVCLFSDSDFRGRMVVFQEEFANFQWIDFNNQVSSALVLDGVWDLYKDSSYSNTKWKIETDADKIGIYKDPYPFKNNVVSSIKPV